MTSGYIGDHWRREEWGKLRGLGETTWVYSGQSQRQKNRYSWHAAWGRVLFSTPSGVPVRYQLALSCFVWERFGATSVRKISNIRRVWSGLSPLLSRADGSVIGTGIGNELLNMNSTVTWVCIPPEETWKNCVPSLTDATLRWPLAVGFLGLRLSTSAQSRFREVWGDVRCGLGLVLII